ncbi:hypothetical protein AAFC00_007165 [Neodothiora populina]
MASGHEPTASPQPHCAICGGDSSVCGHEEERLKRALNEAQSRWLANEQIRGARHWVLSHAREMILFTYHGLEAQRRAQYEAHLVTIPYYNLYQIYQDGAPLPPHQLENLKAQIHQAWEHMHRTLDKDWQNCLQKYPELLDYYFSLVKLEVPEEQDTRVEHPMINQGEKKRRRDKRRGSADHRGLRGIPAMPANAAFGFGRFSSPSIPMPSPGASAYGGFPPY